MSSPNFDSSPRYRAVRAPKQMADLCAMKINFQNRAENFEARFEGNGKTGVLFCAQTPALFKFEYSNEQTVRMCMLTRAGANKIITSPLPLPVLA